MRTDTSDDGGTPEPSKTRRKREAEALQALGERLVGLKPSQLARIPMDDELREAVQAAQRIHARGGRRRQLQLVGKLMRAADAQAIAQALAALESVRQRDADRLHELEDWRARLLNGETGAIEALAEQYPGVDRAAVTDLVRRATCRAGTRALFRYLDRAIPPPGPSSDGA
jgi:ribosome-associated protein